MLIRDIRMRNSAMWMQHYLACDGLTISGLEVYNHCNQNNDMIDIDGCRNVIISNCFGDTDDDALTFKSTSPLPCENITVTNCVLSSHCNAIKCGTESTGGFRNITISNCVIKPSSDTVPIFGFPRGISGISLEIVDGGSMDGIAINNIIMEGPEVPLFIRLGNRARKYTGDAASPAMGSLKNITISNVIAKNAGRTGCSITGLPGYPVENIQISGMMLEFEGGVKDPVPAYGVPELADLFVRHTKGVSLSNSRAWYILEDARPAIVSVDAPDLTTQGFITAASMDLP
jgi:polygalacturonase